MSMLVWKARYFYMSLSDEKDYQQVSPLPNNPIPALDRPELTQHPDKKQLIFGVGLAISSNILFGVLYLYSSWLTPMSGTQVFIWRMISMWVILMLFLIVTGKLQKNIAFLRQFNTKQWILFLIPTPIFASQLWLFMWAPVNNQGVQIAMGYFLFPLVMVLIGFLFLKEKLARLQWLAVGLAALGVAGELIRTQSFSWVTFWACGTYPIYYIIRRALNVTAVVGLMVDLTLIMPFMLLYLYFSPSTLSLAFSSANMFMLVCGLGIVSVLAMLSNIDASHLLPVNLFGMLSYLEPALLFILAIVVLHSPIDTYMLYTYGLMWAGIACLILHGIRSMKYQRHQH